MRSNGSSGHEDSKVAMRIIAGLAKGRRLKAPPGLVTRPMTDRVREALFSAIVHLVPGAEVLDLYAGTGSLGLEALSRGAGSAVFVERNQAALRALRANVSAVGLGGRVVSMDVRRFLTPNPDPPAEADRGAYDLVFVDPPYRDTAASVTGTLRMLGRVTRVHGTVILHRRAGEEPLLVPGFELGETRRYGTSCIRRLVRVPISGG